MLSVARALAGIVGKDINVWLRRPSLIASTLTPALGTVILSVIFGAVGGRLAVALVVLDDGPQATRLAQVIQSSDAYITYRESPEQAKSALQDLNVHAVITIPANFDAAYDAHEPDPVRIEINNLDLDFTNDLRRSLPAAITSFYASQPNSPIAVHMQETDLRSQDISIVQFFLLPSLVLLLTIGGLVNTGLATAREFEDKTIKELTLAPIARGTIVTGKLLAGWLTTLILAGVVIAIGAAFGFLHPSGWYWPLTVGIASLYALAASGLGAALGVALRSISLVTVTSVLIAFYLFFLSGGISVAAFLPDWVQAIAHFTPSYYAVHALDMSVFYASTDQLERDVSIVALAAVATVALGALALRRRITA